MTVWALAGCAVEEDSPVRLVGVGLGVLIERCLRADKDGDGWISFGSTRRSWSELNLVISHGISIE